MYKARSLRTNELVAIKVISLSEAVSKQLHLKSAFFHPDKAVIPLTDFLGTFERFPLLLAVGLPSHAIESLKYAETALPTAYILSKSDHSHDVQSKALIKKD